MSWIINVSRKAIECGNHPSVGEDGVLIQISDTDLRFPKPYHKFRKIYKFSFLDVNYGDKLEDFGISDKDADEIISALTYALERNRNVVVHCTAGLCRSGAVAEVGTLLGFEDKKAPRIPNSMVKHKLMKSLGWTYDSEEEPMVVGMVEVNGILIPEE